MHCSNCGTNTPYPAAACQTCSTPFPAMSGPASESETIGGFASRPADDAPTRLGGAAAGAGSSGQSTGPLEPGAPFGARYRILRELGAGGMGVVYKAWDEELGVPVALKVIRTEVTSDPYLARDVERRFKRELLLARQVTHSNVVRIYDLGEIDGIKYITMLFVEGVDLATLIQREGRLATPRALRMVREVVSGLRAAHDAGVVHRDLKPANIMIDEQDEARIMDFGIARSTSLPPDTHAAPGDGAAKLFELRQQASQLTGTMQGGVVGTVEYMAPEQARGEEVDQRADLYALGLIMYDMLGGAGRAARSDSALVELTARMEQQPPAIGSLNPEVPEALGRVISRCLEPDLNARYASTKDLEADLQRLDDEGNLLPVLRRVSTPQMVGVGILTLSLLAATWWAARPTPAEVTPPPTSVLIADFDNRAGDPVFVGSVEQALAIGLEGAPFISAYPRAEAQRTIATLRPSGHLDAQGARLVAAREGVNVVLAGEITARGDGYALTIKGIDPRDDRRLFSRSARAASKSDVLGAIGSLASTIRRDLGDTANKQQRAADAETVTAGSIEAMSAYAHGKELDRAGKPREALKSLEEAAALDKNFGMAYAHIGTIYRNLKMDDKAKQNYDEAFKHLDRMTEREKYRTYGVYYFGVVRNYKEAIKNYTKLVQLYPADNTGYANLALALLYDRNIPQAVAMGKKAVDIYPRNLLQRTNYATYSMYAGDFKTALAESDRVLQDNPGYEWANLTHALSALASGDEAAARATYARLGGLGPLGASLSHMGLADLEMYYGRPKSALQILDLGIAADEREKDTSNLGLKLVAAAEAHLSLGNRGAAAAAADRASRLTDDEAVLVPAAHVLIEVGRTPRAREIARRLEQMIPPHIRSYARVINADIALHDKRLPEAIDELQAAEQLHDSWIVHLLLGRAFQAAGQFPEASAQWESCVRRRGEATDVFFADTSSLRYLPPVYYWLGRAQEAAGAKDAAAASYGEYLKIRSGTGGSDPLAADARKRLAR